MTLIYISHPFTGNPEANRENARAVTARLSKECVSCVFINPLDLFQWQNLAEIDDGLILSQAVEVMKRCDGVILCDGWRKSRGCNVEYSEAVSRKMDLWGSPDGFLAWYRKERMR